MDTATIPQQALMFRIIEECFESWLNKKHYCQEHNIKEWVIYYWQKRYREYRKIKDQQPGFLPVQVKP